MHYSPYPRVWDNSRSSVSRLGKELSGKSIEGDVLSGSEDHFPTEGA
jgi:hypothetical protein